MFNYYFLSGLISPFSSLIIFSSVCLSFPFTLISVFLYFYNLGFHDDKCGWWFIKTFNTNRGVFGTSLAVHWWGLHASSAGGGGRIWSMIGELRSCMLHSAGKKKKQREKNFQSSPAWFSLWLELHSLISMAYFVVPKDLTKGKENGGQFPCIFQNKVLTPNGYNWPFMVGPCLLVL